MRNCHEKTIPENIGYRAKGMAAASGSTGSDSLPVLCGDLSAKRGRLLGVLAIEPECRSILRITADGPDEEQTMEAVCLFFCCEGIISKTDEGNKKPTQNALSGVKQ